MEAEQHPKVGVKVCPVAGSGTVGVSGGEKNHRKTETPQQEAAEQKAEQLEYTAGLTCPPSSLPLSLLFLAVSHPVKSSPPSLPHLPPPSELPHQTTVSL